MVRVVVVLFQLLAGVLDPPDSRFETHVGGNGGDLRGELRDRVGLLELVEDPVVARLGRVVDGQGQALHRVADRQEAAALVAEAEQGQRLADHRLAAEAVKCRAEGLVEVQPGVERGVGRMIGRAAEEARAVDDALHHVSRSEAEDATGEHHVVAVVDLAPVVPGAGLPGEGQAVAAAAVLDLEKAFRDVQVRSAVLAHRAELHEVCLGRQVAHRVEHVHRALDVVALHPDRVVRVDHRVRRRGAFAQVDDHFRPDLFEQPVHHVLVGQVALNQVRTGPVDGFEGVQTLLEGGDRKGRAAAHLGDPLAAEPGVDAGNLVAAGSQVLRQRPTEIAVDSGNENARGVTPC